MNALLVFFFIAVAAANASLITGPAALVGPAGLGLRGLSRTTLVGPSGSISTIDSGAIASSALLSTSAIGPQIVSSRAIIGGNGLITGASPLGLIGASSLGIIDGGLGHARLIAPGANILGRSILL